jgi:hypothetical protein
VTEGATSSRGLVTHRFKNTNTTVDKPLKMYTHTHTHYGWEFKVKVNEGRDKATKYVTAK